MAWHPAISKPPMPTIERAIEIASSSHAGQIDKAGQPYIFHPLRVMLRVNSEHEQMAAVLHDVVEDTTVTSSTLQRKDFHPKSCVPSLR